MTTEAFVTTYAFPASNHTTGNMTDASFNASLNSFNSSSTNDTTTTGSPNNNQAGGLEQYVLYDVTVGINTYYLWVIFAFGFPGNLLSLLTILRMPSVSSSKMHVAMLAIVDNCALASKVLYHQLTSHEVLLGDAGCKITTFMGNFFSILSSWILVAMTLERFIAVWFPLKVTRIYSKKKATVVLIVIVLATIGFNSIFFAAMHHDQMSDNYAYDDTLRNTMIKETVYVSLAYNATNYCEHHAALKGFMTDYWPWADALAFSIIPCVLVLSSNALIIINVQMSSKTQRQLTNNFDQSSRRMRDQQQITTMLIVISVVFLALMLPNSIFYLVSNSWLESTGEGSYARLEYFFAKQFIHTLSDLNHAVNFYLYFLSMATFRRRFLDTVCCRKPARKPKGASSSVFKTSHSYVSFHSTHSNLKARQEQQQQQQQQHSHSLTNVSDVSSEV